MAGSRKGELKPGLQQGFAKARGRIVYSMFPWVLGEKKQWLQLARFWHSFPIQCWISNGSQGTGALWSAERVCMM